MRNLRALGLALLAAFAISATSAAAAQAEAADLWAAKGAVKIDVTGEEGANSLHTFVASGSDFTCGTGGVSAVHGTAEYTGETPTLTGENIQYTACHTVSFGITFPVTVDMNSCDYHFTAGTMLNENEATGGVEVKYDGEDEITITTFNSGDTAHEEEPRCVVHIPSQVAGGHVVYKNVENATGNGVDAITAKLDVAVKSTTTDLNTFGCNTHETGQLEFAGVLWAEATNELGELVDVAVTGTA